MQNTDYTNENFRALIERLLSMTAASQEGCYVHLLNKTLLDFSLEEKWIDFQFIVDERHVNVIGTASPMNAWVLAPLLCSGSKTRP